MPRLQPYQLVRVVNVQGTPHERDGWKLNQRAPQVGDVGTLVDVLSAPGLPNRYVVECPSAPGDGGTAWVADFAEAELESVG